LARATKQAGGVHFMPTAVNRSWDMKRLLTAKFFAATIALAGTMTVVAPTEANAWACRADSRSAYGWATSPSLRRARYRALRQCAVRTPRYQTCYISWCR
jgi:hypothetical protein